MQHVTLTHLSDWRWFHIQQWWGSVCGRQSLVVNIHVCFMQLKVQITKGTENQQLLRRTFCYMLTQLTWWASLCSLQTPGISHRRQVWRCSRMVSGLHLKLSESKHLRDRRHPVKKQSSALFSIFIARKCLFMSLFELYLPITGLSFTASWVGRGRASLELKQPANNSHAKDKNLVLHMFSPQLLSSKGWRQHLKRLMSACCRALIYIEAEQDIL